MLFWNGNVLWINSWEYCPKGTIHQGASSRRGYCPGVLFVVRGIPLGVGVGKMLDSGIYTNKFSYPYGHTCILMALFKKKKIVMAMLEDQTQKAFNKCNDYLEVRTKLRFVLHLVHPENKN